VEYSFQPKIGPPVTGKELQERADNFAKMLKLKQKQKKKVYADKAPKCASNAGSSRPLDRGYINEGESASMVDAYSYKLK